MRRISILAILAAALAAPPFGRAQTQVEPEDDRLPASGPAAPWEAPEGVKPQAEQEEPVLQLMDKRLDLKPEQRERIKSVMADSGAELKALREKTEKVMRARNEKIRALLADEQKPKFDEITVELRRRMQGAPSPGSGPSGLHPDRRRKPGPPEEDDTNLRRTGLEETRELPPPEMWHDGRKGAAPDPGSGSPDEQAPAAGPDQNALPSPQK